VPFVGDGVHAEQATGLRRFCGGLPEDQQIEARVVELADRSSTGPPALIFQAQPRKTVAGLRRVLRQVREGV